MRTIVSGVMFLVLGLCLTTSPATAADDPPTHGDFVEMNATLKEIARLLKQQAEAQKVDVLMKRVTLAATQLASAQDRLNRIGGERRSVESERNELDTRLAMLQKEAVSSPEADANLARIAGIRNQLQTLQDRLNTLRQEQITAENEIETLRREARDWQTLLDKTITGGS